MLQQHVYGTFSQAPTHPDIHGGKGVPGKGGGVLRARTPQFVAICCVLRMIIPQEGCLPQLPSASAVPLGLPVLTGSRVIHSGSSLSSDGAASLGIFLFFRLGSAGSGLVLGSSSGGVGAAGGPESDDPSRAAAWGGPAHMSRTVMCMWRSRANTACSNSLLQA